MGFWFLGVLNMTGRNPESVDFGPFRFVGGDGLWRGADQVALPPRAFGVLTRLLASPGAVVSKQELLDAVWPDTFVTESSLLEAIGLLREALGDDRKAPTYIQTVHRRGYRFIGLIGLPKTSSPQDPKTSEDPWRPILVASAAYVVTTVCAAVVFAVFGQHPVERRTSRFSVSLPSSAPVDSQRGSVAVSADGAQMVYVAASGTRSQLFLRTVDRDEPRPLAGTEDAADPFFSPDGQWIGFFARGSLQKVRTSGGSPVVLSVVRAAAGATWSADDTITFGGVAGGGLARISARASEPGEPVVIATPAAGARELRFGWPDVLPNGRGVVFTALTIAGSNVLVLDSRSGALTTIATDAAFGRYSPTGHLVFERRGRLEAARFSLATLSTLDAPTAVVTGLAQGAMLEGPRFAFSRTGALVYVPGAQTDRDAPLHWLDTHGQLERVALPAPRSGDVDSAPDQRRVALALDDESGPRVWVGDAAEGTLRRFADGDGQSVRPAWRPNGLEIAFAYSKAGPFNLFLKPIAGDGGAAAMTASPYNQFPTSWSGDGQHLAFTEFQPLTGADIWVLDLATHERRAVVRTLFDETWARFSPDGEWLAYMSNESGRWEVYVRPARGMGPRVRISAAGGVWPSWSRDGRSLYFNGNGTTMAATVRTSPTLSASSPIVIPGADAMVLAGSATAGDRLLVRQAGPAPEARDELRVVLEWFTELTRLVQPS
jgi:DNA-binding winged helix-turn-helix (wHTH) protein